MANTTWYGDGTATAAVGSRTVTGADTGWLTEVAGLTPIKVGDKFGIHVGRPIVIEQIISDTELLLADDWPGPAQTDAPYKVELTSPTIAAVEAMRRLLASLSNGNLDSLSEITVGTDDVPIGIGPGVFGTINKAALVNGVEFDVQVNALADRAAYNAAAAGFKVLVSNVGDGRAALYSKNSATSGDWSNPSYITGPNGAAGPYTEITVGPTTTLPAGSPATVTPVIVDADTIRLDFGLPKGLDGSGTGDVTGAASSVDGQFAAANGASGKSLKFLTVAQANQALGGWEPIGLINLTGQTGAVITDLSAFVIVKVSYFYVLSSDFLMLQVSTNNGSTFANTGYRYNLMQNTYNGSTNAVTADNNTNNTSFAMGQATTAGEIVIHSFNKALNSAALSTHNIKESASTITRVIHQEYQTAVALNAFRLQNTGAGAVTGRFFIEGIRG
jgi:hypothetical protein